MIRLMSAEKYEEPPILLGVIYRAEDLGFLIAAQTAKDPTGNYLNELYSETELLDNLNPNIHVYLDEETLEVCVITGNGDVTTG